MFARYSKILKTLEKEGFLGYTLIAGDANQMLVAWMVTSSVQVQCVDAHCAASAPSFLRAIILTAIVNYIGKSRLCN
jgi:hypothetical protein